MRLPGTWQAPADGCRLIGSIDPPRRLEPAASCWRRVWLGSGQVGRHVVEGEGEPAQLAGCSDPKSGPTGPRRRARGRPRRNATPDSMRKSSGCLAKRALGTLTGTVRSWAERDAAVAAAWAASGVTDGRDHLTVLY